jgi:hypothetical protein
MSFLVLAIQRLPAMRSQSERVTMFQSKEIILSKSIGCEIANACSKPRPLPPLHDNVERIVSPYMVGSRPTISRERAGGLIPRGRNARKVGFQGHQLAYPWNPRHICDQLVLYRTRRNRGLDRGI